MILQECPRILFPGRKATRIRIAAPAPVEESACFIQSSDRKLHNFALSNKEQSKRAQLSRRNGDGPSVFNGEEIVESNAGNSSTCYKNGQALTTAPLASSAQGVCISSATVRSSWIRESRDTAYIQPWIHRAFAIPPDCRPLSPILRCRTSYEFFACSLDSQHLYSSGEASDEAWKGEQGKHAETSVGGHDESWTCETRGDERGCSRQIRRLGGFTFTLDVDDANAPVNCRCESAMEEEG